MGHSKGIIIKNEKFKGLKEATNDDVVDCKKKDQPAEEGTEPKLKQKKEEILFELDACPRRW